MFEKAGVFSLPPAHSIPRPEVNLRNPLPAVDLRAPEIKKVLSLSQYSLTLNDLQSRKELCISIPYGQKVTTHELQLLITIIQSLLVYLKSTWVVLKQVQRKVELHLVCVRDKSRNLS